MAIKEMMSEKPVSGAEDVPASAETLGSCRVEGDGGDGLSAWTSLRAEYNSGSRTPAVHQLVRP